MRLRETVLLAVPALLLGCPVDGPLEEDAGVEDAGVEDAGVEDAGVEDAGVEDAGLANLVETATDAGTFSTLVSALQATGLDETLAGEGPFTVFAPTDDAFAGLPEGVLATLDEETLTGLLTYHVLGEALTAESLTGRTEVTPLAGGTIQLDPVGDTLVLNGTAEVTAADIEASNGVIHAINGVLFPEGIPFPGTHPQALSAYPRFSTLVDAVTTADLADDLAAEGPFTVFAPPDAAFEAAGIDLGALTMEELADVLLYHVVPGELAAEDLAALTSVTTLSGEDIALSTSDGTLLLNDDTAVTYAGFETTNGVIHVIEDVLLPPGM